MAEQTCMHPRNPYKIPPNFKDLALQYPEFSKHVNEAGKVDFRDLQALRCLTTTLLKRDFNLDVEIPVNHLIPTLPLRLNYLLWLEDLLAVRKIGQQNVAVINGIDIGTGSSCIYPLLGCSRNQNWTFVATESNEVSVEWAQKNVLKNKLEERVKIVHVRDTDILQGVIKDLSETFDFCMCNPPFFSIDEMGVGNVESPKEDPGGSRPPPIGLNSPKESERQAEGGEVQFIKQMIKDSLELRETVKIYSTMFGKKSSFSEVKKILYETEEIQHIAKTQFCQGKTTRWGIAWTFIPNLELEKVSSMRRVKNKPPVLYLLPPGIEELKYSIAGILGRMKFLLSLLEVRYEIVKFNKYLASVRFVATKNTWSHQRRRRRQMLMQQKTLQKNPQEEKPVTEMAKNCLEVTSNINQGGNEQLDKTNKIRKVEESDQIPPSKKAKLQDPDLNQATVDVREQDGCSTASLTVESPYLIKCKLTIRRVAENFAIELKVIDGTLGNDAPHQIMQFFKNKLK